jgi:hypothetical protein
MNEKLLRGLLKESERQIFGWGSCPDEMDLAEFAEGHLSEEARRAFERHLSACEACREQVAFLLRTQDEPVATEAPPALIRQAEELAAHRPAEAPGWRWQWGTAALAAAVLLVVVLTHLPSPGPAPDAPLPRPPQAESQRPATPRVERAPATEAPQDVRKGASAATAPAMIAPREGLRLPGEDILLRWRGVPGSVFYEVKVTTFEGSVVWSARTEQTELRAPAKAFPATGGKFFAWVQAHLPNGKTLASKVVGFEVVSKE